MNKLLNQIKQYFKELCQLEKFNLLEIRNLITNFEYFINEFAKYEKEYEKLKLEIEKLENKNK